MPDVPATREEIEAANPTPSLLEHGQAYSRECGAAAERARIVAWLRAKEAWANAKLDESGAYPDWWEHERDIWWEAADAIERRAHRETSDGE